MPIDLKFKLSTESTFDYAPSKSGVGNSTVNVLCPGNTGRLMKSQPVSVVSGSASQSVAVTQEGAPVNTTWHSIEVSAGLSDTSLALVGYSNSKTLHFAATPAVENGLELTFGTIRWMEETDADTGANGISMTTSQAAGGVTGDPGATRRYKFVLNVSFTTNGSAVSRSCTVAVTDSSGTRREMTVTQAGGAALSVTPGNTTVPPIPGTLTLNITTNGTPTVNISQPSSSLTPGEIERTGPDTYSMALTYGENQNGYTVTLGFLRFSIAEDPAVRVDVTVYQEGAYHGLTIGPSSAVDVGESVTINAMNEVNHVPMQVDEWWASDPSKVSITPGGSQCTVTGLAPGTVTIYAHKVGHRDASCSLTVQAGAGGALTGIDIDQGDELEITTGASTQLTVTLSPPGVEASVSWSTNKSSVATVDNGLVTAVEPGTCVITATATDGVNTHTDSIVIYVPVSQPSNNYTLRVHNNTGESQTLLISYGGGTPQAVAIGPYPNAQNVMIPAAGSPLTVTLSVNSQYDVTVNPQSVTFTTTDKTKDVTLSM